MAAPVPGGGGRGRCRGGEGRGAAADRGGEEAAPWPRTCVAGDREGHAAAGLAQAEGMGIGVAHAAGMGTRRGK